MKLNGVVQKTEGLSGAYLKEMVMTAYMIRSEQGRKINKEILSESIEEILRLKRVVNPNFNAKGGASNTLYG